MPEYKSLGNTIREAVFKAKEAPTMLPDETIERLELQDEDVLDLSEKTSEEEEEEERKRHAEARSREQAQHDRKLDAGSKQDQEAEKKRHKAAKDLEKRRHTYDRRSKEKFAGKRTTSVEHVETVDEATSPSGPKATRPSDEKVPPTGPKTPNKPNVKKPAPKKPTYRPRRAHHIGGRDHAFWRAEKTVGEEVEQVDENLGYASSKDGSQTFVVSKRKKGNPYKAHGTDSVSMAVVDSKTGKTIKDWGSHIDLKSATTFAKNKGFTNMKSTAPAGLPKKAYEDVELDEAIWAKNVGQDAIRQIRAATPPYTVVAIKGKKVVDQSKPIMVSNQVPAFLHDFIKKNSDEALTIGVEDKSGQMVYTYHKPRGVRREETEIDEASPYKNPNKDGMISKTSEKSAARAAKARRDIRIKLANRKKKAAQKTDEEFEMDEARSAGYKMPQSKDPYTVKYAASKRGKIQVTVVDGEKAAKKFLADVKKKGMNGIITKGGHQNEEVEIDEAGEIRGAARLMGIKPGQNPRLRAKDAKDVDLNDFLKDVSSMIARGAKPTEVRKTIQDLLPMMKKRGVKLTPQQKAALKQLGIKEDFELDEGGMIGRTKPSRELNVSREEKPHLAGKSSLKDKKRAAHKSERAKTGAALGRALKALKAKKDNQ